MAKSFNQKQKLLLILSYLQENTDEKHAVTAEQLKTYLSNNGITSERKSIYSDINTLIDMGYDIITRKGKDGGYALVSRDFELAELKLLVDAVQSSKFISEKKSNKLIKKIEKLTSRHEGHKLQRQVFVANRVKTDNESVFYNIDGIHEGIATKHVISFVYLEWNLKKQLVPRNGGKRYVVKPMLLVWDDENYYLVAKDATTDVTKHFRVDKMTEIVVEEDSFTDNETDATPAQYSKEHFAMFSGENEIVTVRFDRKLIGVVLDRFGKDVSIIPKDENTFDARLKVKVSNQFFGWLTGFGQSAKIIGPDNVAEEYKQLVKEIYDKYQ